MTPLAIYLLAVTAGAQETAGRPELIPAQRGDTAESTHPEHVNIWMAAASQESCPEVGALRERASEVARGLPETEWKPDVYFGMTRSHDEAEGSVELRYQGRELFRKDLAAESCADVVEALLLSLQIYVDMVRKSDLAAAEEAASGQSDGITEVAPPGWPGPDIDPASVSPTEGDPFGRDPQRVVLPPAVRPELLFGMVRGFNLLPNSAWGGTGAELSMVLPVGPQVSIDGGARFLSSLPFAVDGARYQFTSTSFSMGPGHSWWLSDIASLRVNLMAVVTFIHTSTTVGARRAGSPPYGSAGAALNFNLAVNPWRALMLEARVGGQALTLNGIYLTPDGDTVWEQPLLGTVGGLYVGWGGPNSARKREKSQAAARDADFSEGFSSSEQ
jgi:hypothetical protein